VSFREPLEEFSLLAEQNTHSASSVTFCMSGSITGNYNRMIAFLKIRIKIGPYTPPYTWHPCRAAVMLHDQKSMVVFFKEGYELERRRGEHIIVFD
jgi:hypothetical protein